MAFKGNISIALKASQSPPAGHAPDVVGKLTMDLALSEGTGDNAAHGYVVDSSLSLSASSTVNLDLTARQDVFGSAVAGVELVAFGIKSAATNGDDVEISPNATNGFLGFLKDPSDVAIIPPGGCFVWINPKDGSHAISASNQVLDITNTDGSTASIDTFFVFKTS